MIVWKYSKMSAEQRQQIIDLLEQGVNARQVSIRLGHQYKTVWKIEKKLKADWTHRDPGPFLVGDVVDRINNAGGLICGVVTGFCCNDKFVRVRTDDGRHRIWLKANLGNVDADLRTLGPVPPSCE
jgi:hypothetical protein